METNAVKNLASVLELTRQLKPATAQKFSQDVNNYVSRSNDDLKAYKTADFEPKEDISHSNSFEKTLAGKIDKIDKPISSVSDDQHDTISSDSEIAAHENIETKVDETKVDETPTDEKAVDENPVEENKVEETPEQPEKKAEEVITALMEIINLMTNGQTDQSVNLTQTELEPDSDIAKLVNQLKDAGFDIDLNKLAQLTTEQKTQVSQLLATIVEKLQNPEQGNLLTVEKPQILTPTENTNPQQTVDNQAVLQNLAVSQTSNPSDDTENADIQPVQQSAEPKNQKAIEVLTQLLTGKIDNPEAKQAIENILARFTGQDIKQNTQQVSPQNNQNSPQNSVAELISTPIKAAIASEPAQNVIQSPENVLVETKTEQSLTQNTLKAAEIVVQQDAKPKTSQNSNANNAVNEPQTQVQTDSSSKIDTQLFSNENADSAFTNLDNKSGGNKLQADSSFEQLVINQTTTREVGANNAPLPPIAKSQPNTSALADIAKQINESIQNTIIAGQKSIVIKLNPAELGSVTMKFSEQGGQIAGTLEVSKLQTKIEIQQALPNILRNLADAGIAVKKLDVVLSNSDTFSQNQQKEYASNENQYQQQNSQQNSYKDNSSFYNWLSGAKDLISSAYNNSGYQTSFSDRSVNLLA